MHDFTADDPEELSFLEGAHLEIIDDKRDDGWWKARLNGKIGLIPSSFVEDVWSGRKQLDKFVVYFK